MKKLVNKFFFSLSIFSLSLASVSANAAEATPKAKEYAKELVANMHVSNAGENFSKAFSQTMMNNSPHKNCMNREYFVKEMSATMAKYMDMVMKEKEADIIKIYTDAYSEQELKEITDFYKTPTGKKTMQKMPEVISASMQLVNGVLMQKQAEFSADISRIAKGSVDSTCMEQQRQQPGKAKSEGPQSKPVN